MVKGELMIKHTLSNFEEALTELKSSVSKMGGLTEKLCKDGLYAFISSNVDMVENCNEQDKIIDDAERSINNQTYNNIEVVISDHSSNNKIKIFLKKFKKKYTVRYYHNPDMKGNSSHNTNNAINNCQGEYIKILFMDDYLYNNKAIANIVDHFDKYPSKKWLVNSYEHTKDYKTYFNHHRPSISENIIFCNRIGCPSCLTIHKSVKERFDETLRWFMDGDYYYRLHKLYNNPIYLYSVKGKSNVITLIHNDQVTNECHTNNQLINKEKTYINDKHYVSTLNNSTAYMD